MRACVDGRFRTYMNMLTFSTKEKPDTHNIHTIYMYAFPPYLLLLLLCLEK